MLLQRRSELTPGGIVGLGVDGRNASAVGIVKEDRRVVGAGEVDGVSRDEDMAVDAREDAAVQAGTEFEVRGEDEDAAGGRVDVGVDGDEVSGFGDGHGRAHAYAGGLGEDAFEAVEGDLDAMEVGAEERVRPRIVAQDM